MGSIAIAGLFFGMLIASEIGRRIGLARLARNPAGLAQGVGSAETSLFALLGLLIAFSFSGAASRFEARRHLIIEETNAIGTAYLRLDLLPSDAQPELRALFRQYVDTRFLTYRDVRDEAATAMRLAESTALQADIWTKASTAGRSPDASAQATMLLVPALNDMIDITATRAMATQNHPPLIIFFLLGGLSLGGALLIGYDTSPNKERSWFHTLAFATILTLTVYVILDLEVPRLGLIRVDDADQAFIELRNTMQ